MDFVAIFTAVKLSHWIGVGGCGYPISTDVDWMGTTYWPLMNTVPNSDSAIDVIMLRSILQTTCTRPFMIGVKVCVSFPADIFSARKICHWLCFWFWR